MTDPYQGREQTSTKHFILRRYLQTLAFKILQSGADMPLSYVDGFSGPWESQTQDYSDTSFMIALGILKDAQERVQKLSGKRVGVRCLFVESNKAAFDELSAAVMRFHEPSRDFRVATYHGKFEAAVPTILEYVKGSFALTFIDPTGWTGYDFGKTYPLLQHTPGEVLLNYMFDHINRFTAWDDDKIVASFDGILGADWANRLNPKLSRSDGVEALFRSAFHKAGKFKYVLLTPIEKPSERTHFCIAYGTRSTAGLKVYRDVEFKALSQHGARRMEAAAEAELAATGQVDMFAGIITTDNRSVETQIADIKHHAEAWVVNLLRTEAGGIKFDRLWPMVIDNFMLRVTDVKEICVQLGRDGQIETPWRVSTPKRPKPNDADLIRLKA